MATQVLEINPSGTELVNWEVLLIYSTHMYFILQQMSDIRGLHGRLECQLFAKTFTDELDELLPVSDCIRAQLR